jgi:hypothetical protein
MEVISIMFENFINKFSKFNSSNRSEDQSEREKLIAVYRELLQKMEESGSSFDTDLVSVESFQKMIRGYSSEKIKELYSAFKMMIESVDKVRDGATESGVYREHHYIFAYRVMPKLFFMAETFQRFIDVTVEKDGSLQSIWDYSFSEVEDRFTNRYVDSSGLKLEKVETEELNGLLITLPEAKFAPEAVAILLLVSKNDKSIGKFYTLELSLSPFSNEPTTMFCETVIAEKSDQNINFHRSNSGPIDKSEFLQKAIESF